MIQTQQGSSSHHPQIECEFESEWTKTAICIVHTVQKLTLDISHYLFFFLLILPYDQSQ